MKYGLKCTLPDLQVVTNMLYEGRSSISVTYPPLGDIIKVTLKNQGVKISPMIRNAYRQCYDDFCSSNQECRHEIPPHDSFLEAFYCSGIPPLTNVENFLVKKIQHRDVLRGEKPLWIGYDTCVLRRRLYSVLRRMLSDHSLHDAIGHAVTNGVTDELHLGMDKKYKPQFLEQFEKSFLESEAFLNQALLEARLHRIGLMDIDQMKKHDVFQELPSEIGDLAIIKGYAEFEKNRNAELVLFSADNNFIEMATDSSLNSYFVRYQPRQLEDYLQKKILGLDTFTSLVYHTAIVYGYIQINDFVVQSIWRGKGFQDWKNGFVMVTPSDGVKPEFERTINILQTMRKERLF